MTVLLRIRFPHLKTFIRSERIALDCFRFDNRLGPWQSVDNQHGLPPQPFPHIVFSPVMQYCPLKITAAVRIL